MVLKRTAVGAAISVAVAVVAVGLSSWLLLPGAFGDGVWAVVVGLLVIPVAAAGGAVTGLVIHVILTARSRRQGGTAAASALLTRVLIGAVVGLAAAGMGVAVYGFGIYLPYLQAYASGGYSPADDSERLARAFGDIAVSFIAVWGPVGIVAGCVGGAVVSFGFHRRATVASPDRSGVDGAASDSTEPKASSLRRLAGAGAGVGLVVAAVPFVGYLYYLFLPGVVRAATHAPAALGSVLEDMPPFVLFIYGMLLAPIGAVVGAIIGTVIWLVRGIRAPAPADDTRVTSTGPSLVRHLTGGALAALVMVWTMLAVYGLGRFLPQAFGHRTESWLIRAEWMGQVFRHLVLLYVLFGVPSAIIAGSLVGLLVFLARRASRRRRAQRRYPSAVPSDRDVSGDARLEGAHPLD
ncbi:hypothetical protein [Microbacterium sp.]|uniref:hypothetical protein n=1 Tax=Microbacterium sp. TaxID=51671 RepID=UPI0039E3677F